MTKKHAESAVLQEVICPVCAAYPNGDPNHLTDDLPTHLTVEHRALEISSLSLALHSEGVVHASSHVTHSLRVAA